jgi:hypothetical protein
MNAILGIIILNMLLLQRWRGQNGLRIWFEQTQEILRGLNARQYQDQGMHAQPLLSVFDEHLRSGRLQPQALRSLLTWIRKLEQADAERLRLGYSAALRLGMAAGLGLGTSLLLDGSWFLRGSDNPALWLLLVGEGMILALWLRRLQAHPLATSMSLQAKFTRAWLGQSRGGPWHETWVKQGERGRVSGRDVRDEQMQLLEDWLIEGSREQEKRLTWADELFGLVELASSVYFLGTACTLPLLKLWGG